MEYQRYLEVCQTAVHRAGEVLRGHLGRVEAREKGPSDLVTDADLAAQEAVREVVLGAFPGHYLLGEEGPRAAVPPDAYCWVVDPLDGTTNFVHEVPFFSVSLALREGDRLLVGAIYDPMARECFTAAAGSGAWLNGRRLRTSGATQLREALVAAGFPAQARKHSPDVLVFLETLAYCQAARRIGSAALNLAYVAAGRMDAFASFSTKIWDVAAGILMVQESGGVVTDPVGGRFDLDRPHFVAAATPQLHQAFLELVGRAVPKDRQ